MGLSTPVVPHHFSCGTSSVTIHPFSLACLSFMPLPWWLLGFVCLGCILSLTVWWLLTLSVGDALHFISMGENLGLPGAPIYPMTWLSPKCHEQSMQEVGVKDGPYYITGFL